jgi:hypothetical protein
MIVNGRLVLSRISMVELLESAAQLSHSPCRTMTQIKQQTTRSNAPKMRTALQGVAPGSKDALVAPVSNVESPIQSDKVRCTAYSRLSVYFAACA